MPLSSNRPARRPLRFVVVSLLVAGVLAGLPSCGKPAASTPYPPKKVAEDLTAKLKKVQGEVAALEQAAVADYRALEARRTTLAGSTPAEIEAFNRDAAQYQVTREALKRRQEELKILATDEEASREAVAIREIPTVDLLNRLRAAINSNDWNGQLFCLEQALSKHRETKTFAQISTLAKPQLGRVSRADIERQAAARPNASEFQTVTQQIQSIVNQTPPLQPSKIGNTVWIGFHDGAIKPNFKTITLAELTRGREFYTADTAWMQGAPDVFYVAREIEFNPMTKYFYTDRTKAKKKLSPAEYDTLLKLYHRLGEIEGQSAPNVANQTAETWAKWEALRKSWP